MLRARATRWFEVITTRRDMAGVMQALAGTGAVELEARPLEGLQPVLPQLDEFFKEFEAQKKAYGAFWPVVTVARRHPDEEPGAMLGRIKGTLEEWERQARPEIETCQRLETVAGELALLGDLVAAAGGYPFAGLPGEGEGILDRAMFYVKTAPKAEPDAEGVLALGYPAREGQFYVAIGDKGDVAAFRTEMAALRAKELHMPAGMFGSGETDAAAAVASALECKARQAEAAHARIDAIGTALGLEDALARVALFRWLRDNEAHLQGSDWTVRICGWIDPDEIDRVEAALAEAGADTVLSLAPEGGEAGAPMLLRNPGWLKPFEFFPRLLGMPGMGEADPSLITALITPLMFGFMFGDAGQGAILVAIGLWGRRQYPLLALLVPGGIMAIFFGLMFGSVFSREDIVPALWLHPLHEPLTVLAVALGMGIVVLLGGVLVDAVQAVWTGRLRHWIYENGGILVAYLSVLLAFWQGIFAWGLLLGLGLMIAGARNADGQFDGGAAVKGLGEFVETLMRLLVSSVSFSRVGAFALAHAGLSAAIVGMADAAGGAVGFVILILGNILIIALEGLVTGIQITRLVLFEFFTRFFHAGGREFRPLRFPEHDFTPSNGDAT